MKIAIISDSHDNLANLKKAIGIIKKEKIKFLIHCGDIFEPETIKEVLKEFSGKIYFVLSNVDEDYFGGAGENYFKNQTHLKIWKGFGEIEVDGKKIAFCHFPELAKGLTATQKYDIVFYGHTHKPWEKKIGKTRLVNPGNLAGVFYRATFAIYDTKTDKLDLEILK